MAILRIPYESLEKPGAYLEFDDYHWTLGSSPTCSPYPPVNNLKILERFTKEQIKTPHVKLIVDNLVKPHPNFKEIIRNQIYQKVE